MGRVGITNSYVIQVAFGGVGGRGIYSESDFSIGKLCSGPPKGCGVGLWSGLEWGGGTC